VGKEQSEGIPAGPADPLAVLLAEALRRLPAADRERLVATLLAGEEK